MIAKIVLNVTKDNIATTILAGYYKFGAATLLMGSYGATCPCVMLKWK